MNLVNLCLRIVLMANRAKKLSKRFYTKIQKKLFSFGKGVKELELVTIRQLGKDELSSFWRSMQKILREEH